MTGPARVLDYSAWEPTDADYANMKAANIIGVCRYLTIPDTTFNKAKQILRPEYDKLLALGFSVTLNWEHAKADALNPALGFDHGRMAREQARQLGHPDERPIIQSLDVNYTAAQRDGALQYQERFNEGGGVGPQGIYGARDIIDQCLIRGLVRVGWQTAATSWGPVPGVSPNAAIVQRTSKSYPQFPPSAYDENDPVLPDWGQRSPGLPFPLPEPAALEVAAAVWG